MELELTQAVSSSTGAAGTAADCFRLPSWVQYLLLPLEILDIVLDFILAASLWAPKEDGDSAWPDAAWGIALFFFTFVPCCVIIQMFVSCLCGECGGSPSKARILVTLLVRFLIEDSTSIFIFINVPSELGSTASKVNLYLSIGTGAAVFLLSLIAAMVLWRKRKEARCPLFFLGAVLLATIGLLILLGIRVARRSFLHTDQEIIFEGVVGLIVYTIGLLFGFCFFFLSLSDL